MPYRDKDGNRNYKREYKMYHGLKKQKANRAARGRARTAKGLKVGDSREVDHKVPLHRGGGNGKKNLRVVSRDTNRKRKWNSNS